MLPFSPSVLLYLRIFCCEIWKEKKKVSLLSVLVTLGITLTLVNVVQKGGLFGLSMLFYSVPPDKKLIEISFAIHH